MGKRKQTIFKKRWFDITTRAVLGIRIRMFLGIQDPDQDPLVRGTEPDPDKDPSLFS